MKALPEGYEEIFAVDLQKEKSWRCWSGRSIPESELSENDYQTEVPDLVIWSKKELHPTGVQFFFAKERSKGV